ncbi:uncharacterized protein MELLADRAFT_76561 [Melampsora larici-populina 98AG31]|uniref:Uncharacterized protein n=1 Tax=Melampsora larici-populina (strain 98AG31 / pathotype 3-4-7) TaxID=747676 RepID=F4R5M3_MELLP|nr:uncharacterized protein MELLADRAFT_76561 [Melampsora larici-populina 98AG31]EGG12073.1 hypothetical protein MELLADRAFT_76561 [Melampsora larici-populina 98AG31]
MNTHITATTTMSSSANSMTATTTTQLHPTINLEPITINLNTSSESENESINESSSASPVRSFIIHSRPSLSSVYYNSNCSADEDDLIARTSISTQNLEMNQVEKDGTRTSNEFTLESNQNDGQEVLLTDELTTPRHLQTEFIHPLHLDSSKNQSSTSNLILSSLKSNKNSINDRQQQQQNQQNLNRPSPPRIQTPDLGIPFSSQNLKSTLEHPNHHNVQSNSNSNHHHHPQTINTTTPKNTTVVHNNLISSTSPKISFNPTKLSNQISSLHHSISSNQSTSIKTSSISTVSMHDQAKPSTSSIPADHQTSISARATNNVNSFPRTLNKLEPTQSSTISKQNPPNSSSSQPKLSSLPSPINLSQSTAISSQPFPSTHPSNQLKPNLTSDSSQITPQHSLEHLEHPEHSESPLASSPRDDPPHSPVTSIMTPAQKIAREVRRSFSLAASPPALHHTSQNSHIERNNNISSSLPQPIDPASISPSEPSLLDPSNHSLTPAQAVAHQARLMSTTLTNVTESVTASTSSIPVTQATSNSNIASTSNLSSELTASFCKLKLKKALTPSKPDLKVSLTKSDSPNTITPEPAFRVISGRKGHPGDGKDQTAIVRPLDTGPNAEKITEPKAVKACPSVSSKLPLHTSGSHPPAPTSPKATTFLTSPRLLPSVQVVEPSPSPVRPGSTSLAPSPVSPTPLAPLVLTPADNPPLIPLAVFPTYNEEEEDSGSVDFTDPEAEITEEEEEESEEEEDYDSNPLYIVLSTSLSPRLKDAYDSAKLVLLPTRRALPLDMPRKLPDPNIEFESEWEQWIAAHTFVAAGPDTASSGSKESGKGGVEWVGISKSEDRRVHLSLKPGTGIAEVRLIMSRPGPSSSTTTTTPAVLSINKPIVTPHRTDASTESDLTPALRTAPEFDPQRTIRAKEPHNLPDPIPVSNRFSNISTVTSDLTNTTSCSSSSAARSNLLRSPSAATDTSLPFTQSSSGVSRASSEGWSDMPTTPPINPDLIVGKSDQLMGSQVETVINVQYAKIISEETMYRSPPRRVPSPAVALESALSGSKAKKGKEVEQRLRFKAPKWLRPGAAQKEKERERERRENALALARERERERLRLLEGEGGGGLERVRLISLKGPVIERWWQSPVSQSIDSVTETEAENGNTEEIKTDAIGTFDSETWIKLNTDSKFTR